MLFITRYQKNNMAHIESMGMKPGIPVSEVNAWVNKALNNSTIEDFYQQHSGIEFSRMEMEPRKRGGFENKAGKK